MNTDLQRIVWLASYPGSGNTWLRVVLSNLLSRGDTPADINALTVRANAASRAWFDDYAGMRAADLREEEIEELRPLVYEAIAAKLPPPLFMKIHDAFRYSASGRALVSTRATRAAIYVIRNPLDVAVAYAHHRNVSFDDILRTMADETHCLSGSADGILPQLKQQLGSWSTHVHSWVDAPVRVHVARYEDMRRDPLSTFGAIADFAEIPCTQQRLRLAIQFSAFDELRRQESEAGFRERSRRALRFFRRGESGAWRDELVAAQAQQIIDTHSIIMRRFGYLSPEGAPL